MAGITGKETEPEILVRKFLFSKGLRYRKNVKKLPGKPDIVLSKYRTVIFVHGCFWHGHSDCKKAALPKTNNSFWKTKILNNTERDRSNYLKLKKLKWRVIVIWQCELRNQEIANKTLNRLFRSLQQ